MAPDRSAGPPDLPRKPPSEDDTEPPATQDPREAVARLNASALGTSTRLIFRLDESAQRLVISVVDAESGQVLNEIPVDIALRLAQRLRPGGQSLFHERG